MLWLSWTKRSVRPRTASSSLWLKLSKKKPRESPNTAGSTSRTSASVVGRACIRLALPCPLCSPIAARSEHLAAGELPQVLAVTRLAERGGASLQLAVVDPTLPPGDLLGTGNFETLPLLDRGDERAGLEERIVRSGVEPRVTAPQELHREPLLLEVETVEIGDLQLAARRGLDPTRKLDHVLVVEVQAGHCVPGLRLGGLLLDAHGAPARIELDHAVPLRIVHGVREDRRSFAARIGGLEHLLELVPIEDVVTQDQRRRPSAHEVGADDEGLGEPVRPRLNRVLEVDAPRRAVTEELREPRGVLRRGDDEDVPDPGQHEHRERVIDHRLVVHRQELLRHRQRRWKEPRARAAGEDDPFSLGGHSVPGVGLPSPAALPCFGLWVERTRRASARCRRPDLTLVPPALAAACAAGLPQQVYRNSSLAASSAAFVPPVLFDSSRCIGEMGSDGETWTSSRRRRPTRRRRKADTNAPTPAHSMYRPPRRERHSYGDSECSGKASGKEG